MTTRKITYAGVLLALSIVLPQVVHFTGIPEAGKVLLPMHLPVLLGGLVMGPIFGLILGVLAPVISFFISGMPLAARLPFMIIELGMYGLTAGLFYYTLGFRNRRLGIYVSLIVSMLAGRIVYAISLVVAASLFSIQAGGVEAALIATTTGIFGIAIQLVLIPPIVYALKRGGQLDAIHNRNTRDAATKGQESAS